MIPDYITPILSWTPTRRSQMAETQTEAPKTKRKGVSHDEVRATIRDASLPPEVRLSLLALSYADKPLTITEVREAAGLRDRDVILALRMARSLGRITLAGDRYWLKRGA